MRFSFHSKEFSIFEAVKTYTTAYEASPPQGELGSNIHHIIRTLAIFFLIESLAI